MLAGRSESQFPIADQSNAFAVGGMNRIKRGVFLNIDVDIGKFLRKAIKHVARCNGPDIDEFASAQRGEFAHGNLFFFRLIKRRYVFGCRHVDYGFLD